MTEAAPQADPIPPAPIQAVLFDFYDTLGHIDSEPIVESRRMMARRAGVPEDLFFAAWRETFRDRNLGVFGSLQEEIAAALDAVGASVAPETLDELAAYEQRVWCEAVHLYPDTRPTLELLRDTGLKLGLLSNCTIQAAAAIRSQGLDDLLDMPIVSCEVHLVKPDPAIYRLACERLGVEPRACAFVGDGGSRELEGAYGLGMLTLYLQRKGTGAEGAGQPFHRRLGSLAEVPTAIKKGRVRDAKGTRR